jgi:hypothetical protein
MTRVKKVPFEMKVLGQLRKWFLNISSHHAKLIQVSVQLTQAILKIVFTVAYVNSLITNQQPGIFLLLKIPTEYCLTSN